MKMLRQGGRVNFLREGGIQFSEALVSAAFLQAEPCLKNLDELEICSVETASIGDLEDHPFAVARSTTSSRAVSDDRNGEAKASVPKNADPKGPKIEKKNSLEIFNLARKIQSRLKFSILTFRIPHSK